MSAVCIASLLGLRVHDPANVFSGTVLYNLMRDLENRSNPDMYVTELLGGTRSMLSGCYLQLMNAVLSDMPEGCLEVIGCRPKKKGKRSKKNSEKSAADLCDSSNSLLQDVETAVGGNVGCYVVNCDTDNRFSNLSFVDE